MSSRFLGAILLGAALTGLLGVILAKLGWE